MSRGSIAAVLVARGWRRDTNPGHPGECGAVHALALDH